MNVGAAAKALFGYLLGRAFTGAVSVTAAEIERRWPVEPTRRRSPQRRAAAQRAPEARPQQPQKASKPRRKRGPKPERASGVFVADLAEVVAAPGGVDLAAGELEGLEAP